VIDPATGFRRVFIRATIADNPYLAGTEYERALAALPETSRKALLEGRWDVFEAGSIQRMESARACVRALPDSCGMGDMARGG
jgi:hypothetical protein